MKFNTKAQIQILLIFTCILFSTAQCQIYPVFYHPEKEDNDNLKELMEQKKIDFTALPVGYIPYGKSFKAEAFVSEPYDDCDLQTDPDRLKPIMFAGSSRKPGCSWTDKAKIAQEQGVQLLILVENTDQDIHEANYIEKSRESVDISVIMVPKKDGQKLVKAVKEIEHLSFALDFGHPKQNSHVKVEYWMHSVDYTHHSFIIQFKPLYELLKSDKHTKISFHPRIPVVQNKQSEQQGFKNKHVDCLSGGRYCLNASSNVDPKFNKQESLLIDLGTMCVYQQDLELWFQVQENFFLDCLAPYSDDTKYNLYFCFQQIVMTLEGLHTEKYEACMKNEQDNFDILVQDHDLLKKEYKHQISIQQNKAPELLVNGERIQGDINNQHDIYAGVCSAYSHKKYPKFCEQFLGYTPVDFDESLLQEQKDKKTLLIIGLIILGIVFSFIFFYLYVKCLKRQNQIKLHLKVNEMTQSSYLNLSDNINKTNDTEKNEQ